MESTYYVKKRNGSMVQFNPLKIIHAVNSAFISIDNKFTEEAKEISSNIADYVYEIIKHSERDPKYMSVEEIQDEVVSKLMDYSRKDVSIAYIEYRYKRSLARKMNDTDKEILSLIDGTNDYWNNENSNKDAGEVTVQRDYIAGITSSHITKEILLPEDVSKAHSEGILHFHELIVA